MRLWALVTAGEVMDETITITKKEYEELLESQRMLDALVGAGVDNWNGYGDALEMLNAEES